MEKDLHINDELLLIAPALIGLNRNVYTTKPSYFNEFVVAQLEKVNEPSLPFIVELPTYGVPNNYFDTLSINILQKINNQTLSQVEQELQEIAPLLNTISKHLPYTIPSQYFEHLIANKPQATIVKMSGFKTILRYASAAIVTGCIALGGYIFLQKNNVKKDYQLATITNIEKSFEQLSLIEINKGVANAEAFNALVSNEPINNTTIINVEESLGYISDEALQQYLNTTIHNDITSPNNF